MNRQQIVKYIDVQSEPINVISGVLQGGVLSPTLFNIYISDIYDYINSDLLCFADDKTLIRIIYTENDKNILQNDLNKIFEFCRNNSLRLNPNKCEILSISLKSKVSHKYYIDNIELKTVSDHKNVGIIYDNKMYFNIHTNEIKMKAIKKFYTLKHICSRVDGITFLKLYKTYILPVLEYSNLCLVYNLTQNSVLEKVQKRITKYICNKLGIYDMKYCERLKYLNIQTLENRRKYQILKLVFAIKCNTNDKYI